MWWRWTRDPEWLSNSWLMAEGAGGHAVIVDTGGPVEPVDHWIAEHGLTLTHVLCTHRHHDHVAHNDHYRRVHGAPVCAHPADAEAIGAVDLLLEDGAALRSGAMTLRARHIPGHTVGQLAFVVDDRAVLPGDTLFRGSVGGTRAPGHGSFAQLRASVMEVLLALPPATEVLPGHMEATTVARERARNPFVRAWRALDRGEEPAGSPCTALGAPAELLLEARDYDGGTKCWVRLEDGGMEVVPGSRVERLPG